MAQVDTLLIPPSCEATEEEAAPASRARGRPVGDREAKRAELLKAAISVIAQEGFAGASLRRVAQRAGCTTGAVTYYFENKEAMVAAVAESLFDEFDSLLEGQDRIDVRTTFERWLDWTNADDPDPWLALFQLLTHARHDAAIAGVFKRRYGRYQEALASIVARGQSQGLIRDDIAADVLADQLSAIGDGWMIAFPIERERFNPARIQALLDATILMITPPAPAKGRPGA